jgi:hypothetical protein
MAYSKFPRETTSSPQHGDDSNSFSTETVLKFDNATYTRQPESDKERISNQSFNNEEGQQDGPVNLAKSSSMSYVKQSVEGL